MASEPSDFLEGTLAGAPVTYYNQIKDILDNKMETSNWTKQG
jgi:hypothetical protein